MNRLQKFVEYNVTDDSSKRAAYAFAPERLPPPGENLEWKVVSSFNAADAIMRDTGLKDIFILAIDKGCAIVENELASSLNPSAGAASRGQPIQKRLFREQR
ncbi:hypothetical protein NB311A_21216 [Nitrobacter sp. Nb-311A]|uniref:hypothetical protein n=1 Tax=Nitrobacter sp. Nb-311A TaxID=314253 RepID=UPI0000687AE5|nr:hypothetical protein [Nitrobacter sp. Nb-311A]EAQ36499.1 hypothetical protein NB311A_21216 [Nitrobacter sp. Nb-311A]